jgi:hypothetical protein
MTVSHVLQPCGEFGARAVAVFRVASRQAGELAHGTQRYDARAGSDSLKENPQYTRNAIKKMPNGRPKPIKAANPNENVHDRRAILSATSAPLAATKPTIAKNGENVAVS